MELPTELFRELSEFTAGDLELKLFLRDRNYDGILEKLSKSCNSEDDAANQFLDFIVYTMTGLEYGVYNRDMKIACLFFSFGADPKHNIFDGFIDTAHNSPVPIIRFPAFFGRNQTPLPGLQGLNAMLLIAGSEDDDDDDTATTITTTRAFLFLMEFCHSSGFTQKHIDMSELFKNIDRVASDLQFTSIECKNWIVTILLCMKKYSLPNDISVQICKQALPYMLRLKIKEFALRNK